MEEIKYSVILSRRRSISIIVRPDKNITVRAPLRTPLKSIERFVQLKSAWIRKHLNSKPGIKLANNDKKHIDGETFLVLGKEYKLFRTISAEQFVKLNGNLIEVGQKDPDNTDRTIYLLARWYFLKASEVLTEKTGEILSRYSEFRFKPSGLVIRPLKSRWGSCSIKGRITLNSELIKLDPRLIDYVIIHELCHLKFHNHGPDFHKLLGELIPDYKSLRKELRKYLTR
jgi:predicted metal-dependent hydrolase